MIDIELPLVFPRIMTFDDDSRYAGHLLRDCQGRRELFLRALSGRMDLVCIRVICYCGFDLDIWLGGGVVVLIRSRQD